LLPPSPANSFASLTPALGRQDHTASPSASASYVSPRHPRPPQAQLACRDVRETPLKVESGCREDGAISEKTKAKYFCERGWTARLKLKGIFEIRFAPVRPGAGFRPYGPGRGISVGATPPMTRFPISADRDRLGHLAAEDQGCDGGNSSGLSVVCWRGRRS
jgi:hypothetical protein